MQEICRSKILTLWNKMTTNLKEICCNKILTLWNKMTTNLKVYCGTLPKLIPDQLGINYILRNYNKVFTYIYLHKHEGCL